jgi:hypothetical protein
MRENPSGTRPELSKVSASLGQAQLVVGSAPLFISDRIVLAVILPKANWANLIAATVRQGQELAARARIRTAVRTPDDSLKR